jgi:hypothetical protein
MAMPIKVKACSQSEDGKEGWYETLALQLVRLYT